MEEPNNTQPESAYNKPYKMDANVEATLSYIPLVGVAVYLMEKSDKFVRFHAAQSIVFWVAITVLNILATSMWFILGQLLSSVVSLAAVAGWVFLSWKAYNNEEYALPYIGKIARDMANK